MGYIGISKVTLPIMGWQSYGQQLDWLLAVKIRQGLLQPWWQRFLMISPSQQSGGFKQRTWWEKHQNAGCSKQHFLDMCNNFHTLSWFPRAKDNFNEAEWTDDAGGMGLDWGIQWNIPPLRHEVPCHVSDWALQAGNINKACRNLGKSNQLDH
jgi:hypothetical protein